jgi:hypothetical protein
MQQTEGIKKKFALSRYLVNLNQTSPAGFIVKRVFLYDRKETFGTEIKNVLSLICRQHKCIMPFLGSNLLFEHDQWTLITVVTPGRSITFDDIPNTTKLIAGVPSGMPKRHSLGIFHDGYSLASIGTTDGVAR